MSAQSTFIYIKRKTILFSFAAILLTLLGVTPVLAEYIGPQRTVTEQTTVCKVILYECNYVAAKEIWKYTTSNSWLCSSESKPWQAYPSNSPACNAGNSGYEYWDRDDVTQTVTNTYPPATISGSVKNCTLQNGWCITAPQLSLSGVEPVAGYNIFALEGALNGQRFACMNSSCSVQLIQGNNDLMYWALSSFGDSSTIGRLTTKVDSQPPNITGTVTGASGSNGWYLGPVTVNDSASDTTSGLASFTCTLDGTALGSCNTIAVNSEGIHTLVLTAHDNAGLTRALTQTVSIDSKMPALDASVNGTVGSNSWYTAATLNASASDFSPGSDLSSLEYSFDNNEWTTFPVSGTLDLIEGKHNVDIRVKDNAGNTVSSSKSFWLDSVAPNLFINSAGTSGMNGWYTTDITIDASASDDNSGVDTLEYSLNNDDWATYKNPITLDDGTYTVSFWAQDEAGLVTQSEHIYQVDTRAPQIAGSLSGVMGPNGWYTSDVTLSASASDPMPGSDLNSFTYSLNGKPEVPLTDPLVLSDGLSIVELKAQDKAGLYYSIEQAVNIDTLPPSLKIDSTPPDWVKGDITLNGTAQDTGSGLANLEISTDGGQIWQTVKGGDSWSYLWNTPNGPNGIQQVDVRATDLAGLTTQQSINVGVDNYAPEISLPDSWFQWDTVNLEVWDNESGLSEARVEIADPEGRWPKRIIQLDPTQFPLGFKWDRRFGDDSEAEAGTYDMKVIALDNVGNETEKNASIHILLDILPAGPTATIQPTHIVPTSTPRATTTPVSSPSASVPQATKTAIVNVFGDIATVAPASPTPVSLVTPRATPTRSNTLDWLQSIFVPSENEESTTEIGPLVEPQEPIATPSKSSDPFSRENTGVLWGVAATSAVSAAMAYAEEERRRREEEKARLEELEKEEEERREKAKERHGEKMEAQRAQEAAWAAAREEARLEEAERDSHIQVDMKMERIEMEEQARRAVAELEAKKAAEAKKKEEEEKKKAAELNEGLAAYYNATRAGNAVATTPENKDSFWEKAWNWVDDHQTEIAIGFGVVAGVGAILLSGGLAAPMVAAAWTAGAAVAAGATVALGTMALNNHYDRPWNTNLAKNIVAAEVAATVVAGGWFLLQAASTAAGAYCAAHQSTCAPVEPALKAWDAGEEIWLNTKLTVQTWRGDERGAAQTALDLYSEYADGGTPGNTTTKELRNELAALSDDAVELVEKYGDDVIPLLVKYGDEAIDVVGAYGDEGIELLQLHGQDAINLIKNYGDPALKVMKAVDPKAAKRLLETLDDDVLDYAIQRGPEAVSALSLWSEKELQEHGPELALRAEKDAEALAEVRKLVTLGKVDPNNLTAEQRELINAIAANSTQYAEGGQVVLGKWVDISNGFVETANDTGSIHYNPHPEIWEILKELKENRSQASWLINQQVVRNAIDQGLPVEYTLNGVPAKVIENEQSAIEAMFNGRSDAEILEALDVDKMPVRMKELKELRNAGYELIFDEVNNSYVLTLP